MRQQFAPLLGLLLLPALLGGTGPQAFAEEIAAATEQNTIQRDIIQQETLQPDIDITVPRIRIRPPVNQLNLMMLEKLPGKLYVYTSAEPSLRLETNPYQSPRGSLYAPFRKRTDVFRISTDVTVGYALSPKTRVAANYNLLSDHYNDYTPFHLDNAIQSVSLSMEQDLLTTDKWLVRSTMQARELFIGNGTRSGDLLPSMTAMRTIGTNGYGFVNSALDINRGDFVIGETQRLNAIFTVGGGYNVPYDQKSLWMKPLEGVSVSISDTYSFNTDFRNSEGSPRNYQSMILTTELSKPLKRNAPMSMFVRAEPVFNFGHHLKVIGLSGFNFRLFGGMRMAFNKLPIYTMNLDPPKPKKSPEKPKAKRGKIL